MPDVPWSEASLCSGHMYTVKSDLFAPEKLNIGLFQRAGSAIIQFNSISFRGPKPSILNELPDLCVFHRLTGYKYPGSGMTHAFLHFRKFEISLAMRYNIWSVFCFLRSNILPLFEKQPSIQVEKHARNHPILPCHPVLDCEKFQLVLIRTFFFCNKS